MSQYFWEVFFQGAFHRAQGKAFSLGVSIGEPFNNDPPENSKKTFYHVSMLRLTDIFVL